MNKKKLIIIAVSIVIVAILAVCICDFAEWKHDFVYRELEDGTLELKKYNGEEEVVVIPETVFGKKVTRIGDLCFSYDGLNVHTVDIPTTVISVGKRAFHGIEKLTITGGENIEVIEDNAFSASFLQTQFLFSDKLVSIGDCAFLNTNFTGDVVLGDSIEYIGNSAFLWCYGMDEFQISNKLENIGENAFDNEWLRKQEGYVSVGDNILIKFPQLERVIIPQGIKVVNINDAPRNYIVKEIYLPDSVNEISTYMFFETEEMLTIYIPSSVTKVKNSFLFETNNLVREDMDKVTLVVEKDSYGEEYAKQKAQEYGTKYEVVDRIEYPVEK